MKKYFLLIILAFGCVSQKYNYDIVRKMPQQKLTPPKTVLLRDNLFIDETEVTNFAYQEFLSFLKRRDMTKYILMLPDTACWTRADVGITLNDKMVTFYWKHSAYKSYPVVGISPEQANEYCKWRTDMVNAYYYTHNHKINYLEDSLSIYLKKAPHKITFRLPAKEEWEYAAAAGLNYNSYPMGYESLTDSKGKPANNTLEYYTLFSKIFTQYKDTILTAEPTIPVYSGKPNRYGLYQMLGNVSEIINDSLVKGLNFSTPIYSINREETDNESYIINTKTYNYKLTEKYTHPEPWIGFRCVAEVLEN